MKAIYRGTCCWKNGRRHMFSMRHVFSCPAIVGPADDECPYWMHATSEEGAVTLAYTHSVTAGHSVFLEDLCSDRVDEGFVELVRSVARKVAAP